MRELEQLAELDRDARHNLYAYLSQDLQREYPSKAKGKAQKLGSSALESLEISGERVRAQLRDGGQLFRVDMTFPLFDLASDFTLIQCSCQREAMALDLPRCHHMYYLQQRLASGIETLLSRTEPLSPISRLEALWEQAEWKGQALKAEEHWRFILGRDSLEMLCESWSRARYAGEAGWERQKVMDWDAWKKWLAEDRDPAHESWRAAMASGRGHAERESFFLLLALTAAKTASVFYEQSELQPIEGSWQLRIEETSGGFWLHPELAGDRPQMLEGAGLYLRRGKQIFLQALDGRLQTFLKEVLEQKAPIPTAEREPLLQFLARFDPRLLDLSAASAAEQRPVSQMRGTLRLTPFFRGGMKIEVLIAIAPQLLMRPGEGAESVRDLRSGKGSSWLRDLNAERQLARRLILALDLEILPEAEAFVFIAYDDGCALDFMQRAERLRTEGSIDFALEWPEALKNGPAPYAMAPAADASALTVSVGEKKDWFQLDGWLQIDEGTRISLRELLVAVRQQKRYIQLPDGRWTLISDHFKQRMEPLAASSEEDDEGVVLDLAGLGAEGQAASLAAFPFADASQRFWKLVQKARRSRERAPGLPANFRAQLRSYQSDGYRWMHHLCEAGLGACLADDMGLGKTVQTLAILAKMAPKGPSLVIAPSSLAFNWAAEARRFCPDLRLIFMRDLHDRGQGQSFQAGEVLIASYGLIMRYADRLAGIGWNIIVLDEAQAVKNATTKTAQAVQSLSAQWMLGLSGTPLENRLSDLWSLFRTLSPGLFGEWERFKRSYVYPIERDQSEEARQRLKRKLAPFVLRRMKRDYLAELPEKTEIDLWVELSEDERLFYDALRGEAIDKIQGLDMSETGAEAKQRMQVLAALTRLRQAACHRQLVDPSWEGSSTKIDLLKERLVELREAGNTALVFSQFTRFLALIKAQIEALGLRVLYLDGSTPIPERQRLVESFQGGGADVFLISLKAGGTGLNLTRASYVFHMDPWWNPAAEQQASDRAHRMGQRQAVTVYRLRSRETIEEMIYAMHGEKRELVDSLLEGRAPQAQWSWDAVWKMLSQGTVQRRDEMMRKGKDQALHEDMSP